MHNSGTLYSYSSRFNVIVVAPFRPDYFICLVFHHKTEDIFELICPSERFIGLDEIKLIVKNEGDVYAC